ALSLRAITWMQELEQRLCQPPLIAMHNYKWLIYSCILSGVVRRRRLRKFVEHESSRLRIRVFVVLAWILKRNPARNFDAGNAVGPSIILRWPPRRSWLSIHSRFASWPSTRRRHDRSGVMRKPCAANAPAPCSG